MQQTQVRSLIREDPVCRGTKLVCQNYGAYAPESGSHNYWARVQQLLKPSHSRASAQQQEKRLQLEVQALQLEKPPTAMNTQNSGGKKILQDSSTSFWWSEEVWLFLFLAVLGLHCSVEALHWSAQPSLVAVHRLSCPTAFGILVPLPGIKSTGFINSEPPEKSQVRFNGPTFPDSTYSQNPKWRR